MTNITFIGTIIYTEEDEILIANTTFDVDGNLVEHETQNMIEFMKGRLRDFGGTGNSEHAELLDYIQIQAIMSIYDSLAELLEDIKTDGGVIIGSPSETLSLIHI